MQAHRSGISEENLASQDMLPDGIGYWFQQGDSLPEPVCQCRAVEISALSCEILAHSKKRNIIGIFGDQDMSHKVRDYACEVKSKPWQKRQGRAFTTGADQSRAIDPARGTPAKDRAKLPVSNCAGTDAG